MGPLFHRPSAKSGERRSPSRWTRPLARRRSYVVRLRMDSVMRFCFCSLIGRTAPERRVGGRPQSGQLEAEDLPYRNRSAARA